MILRAFSGVFFASALAAATPVFGHGLSAGVAEVQLRGDTAFVVIAPRAELFSVRLDVNGDGTISGEEVQAQRAALQEQFEASFRVRDQGERKPRLTFFDVGVPMNPLPGAPAYVRFTAQLQWPEVPGALVIATEWGPLQLEAVRVESGAPGEWKALGPAEAVVIRGDSVATPPLMRVERVPASSSPRPWAPAFAVVVAGAVLIISMRRRSAVAFEGSR